MALNSNVDRCTLILNGVFLGIVLCGLTSCFILQILVLQEGHDTTLLLSDTIGLADELRQSSDDLTRFIRSYTVTGNASYWEYFQRVIRIRDGMDPLPQEPFRNFWDLYIAKGVAPRGFRSPSSILDRMGRAKFTEAEMQLLARAKNESDWLIDLEDVAYHAMNGLFRPSNTTGLTPAEARAFSVSGTPNQTYAMQLVHSPEYHLYKYRIMQPLDEFAAMSNKRIVEKLEKHHGESVAIVSMLGVMILVLIALIGTYFYRVERDMHSNNNTALECIFAIAKLDLDAVSWLESVKRPNHIQMSFIKIVRILQQVTISSYPTCTAS